MNVVASTGRRVRVFGAVLEVAGPSRRDPRLRLSAVIMTLQVLGQTVLGFKLSIAQILVSVGVAAAVDLGVSVGKDRRLIWPASGILTGNGVAFILRASGTQHGDWWSLNGWWLFAGTALVAITSKYVLRVGGRHFCNPSNLALVACLLIVGSPSVFPQYLWWGPLQGPVIAALAVIVVGAAAILKTVGMVGMAATFAAVFAGAVAVIAAAGRCFVAVWSSDPVCGTRYWEDICLSPELLIFVFFMMSDPKTAPARRGARMVYGALTAVVAACLLAWQPTEYGIKVASLDALTVVCTAVPLLDAARWPTVQSALRGLRRPAVAAAALIAVAASAATLALARDDGLVRLERGATIPGHPRGQ